MDLLGKARKLESTIARKLDDAARELIGSGSLEPIEIVNLIVDVVEREVQPSGRGRRVFPFTRVAVSIVAPSRDARARLEAIVDGKPPLRDRIVDRLTAARCDVDDVVVDVAYVARPQKAWPHQNFNVEFYREARAAAETDGAGARDERSAVAQRRSRPGGVGARSAAVIQLTVLAGTAEQATYSLAADRIDLGRSVEVRDRRHRLIRMNHIAFIEHGSDVNQSVSRRHAHITYDASSRQYRLHDDGSAHGTSVVRNGRTVAVPGGSHGVRLRNGDEIVLGEARLKVGGV
jgi:pSer/pThr/pTyr-binding forkhead associated (FHA) protein